MSGVAALQQIVTLCVVTAMAIGLLELVLYVLLYHYDHEAFPFLTSVVGGLAGWGLAEWLLLSPANEFVSLFDYGLGGVTLGFGVGLLFWGFVRGRHRLAWMMLAPAFLGIALLIIWPFFFELRIAFSTLNMYTVNAWIRGGDLGWAGLQNFVNVFTNSPLQTATFWQLLGRTCVWTAVNVFFHVSLGLGLALLLNRPIRGRAVYRTLLIIPWAMPQVVAVLAWRGEFHPQFGLVNALLEMVGIPGLNWWSDPLPVFASCFIVNIWLGIPFMMIVFLGGLQAIPRSYYEAASIDGAGRWRQFWDITVPLLRPVVVPSVTLGTIWTFNNINVIYLMTGQGGGNEYADILVSALYKSAFTYARFGFSAAFAIVIMAILMAVTIPWMRLSRGGESVVN